MLNNLLLTKTFLFLYQQAWKVVQAAFFINSDIQKKWTLDPMLKFTLLAKNVFLTNLRVLLSNMLIVLKLRPKMHKNRTLLVPNLRVFCFSTKICNFTTSFVQTIYRRIICATNICELSLQNSEFAGLIFVNQRQIWKTKNFFLFFTRHFHCLR